MRLGLPNGLEHASAPGQMRKHSIDEDVGFLRFRRQDRVNNIIDWDDITSLDAREMLNPSELNPLGCLDATPNLSTSAGVAFVNAFLALVPLRKHETAAQTSLRQLAISEDVDSRYAS